MFSGTLVEIYGVQTSADPSVVQRMRARLVEMEALSVEPLYGRPTFVVECMWEAVGAARVMGGPVGWPYKSLRPHEFLDIRKTKTLCLLQALLGLS